MSEKTKHQTGKTALIHRSQIKNAPYNPRIISKTNNAKLLDSIKTHSLVGPLVWNAKTGFLVGGHQRLQNIDVLEKAKEGDYLIEVTEVELSEEKEKSLNIMLNNRQAQGDWDMDLLQDVLADLHSNGVEFEETGFSQFDLHQFGDGFLSGVVAMQTEEELPIIADLQEMKAISAEHEPAFKNNVDSYRGTPSDEMQGDGEDYTEDPSEESEEWSDVEDAEPQPKENARPSLKPSIDPETGEKQWTQEQRDEFKRKREAHNEATKHELEGDVIISMTFQSTAQLKKFIELVGADEDSRTWNKPVIEAMFGVDLSMK